MSSQDKAADSPASTGKTGDVVFKTIAYAAGILILVALAAVFLFLLFQAWPLIGGDQAANTATIESFTGNRAHNFWQYVGPLVFGTVLVSALSLIIAFFISIGIALFISAIPYNFYALLTILMMITLSVTKTDFGPMALHERNALKGDLFTTEARPYADADAHEDTSKGKVIDLVMPVVVLVIACIIGLIYTGGFFSGASFVDAFANSSASVGLVLGGAVALVFTFIYYMMRDVLSFQEFTECIRIHLTLCQ